MDDDTVTPETVLQRFGLTRRAVAVWLGIGGVVVACLLAGEVADIASLLVDALVAVVVLLGVRARCATVVRPRGVTVATFGRPDRTVEWDRLLDVRISRTAHLPARWGQAVLHHRAPDGSIESIAAPHVSTLALGAQLLPAVSYLHEQWAAATEGQPVERDPDGVDAVERERLAELATQRRRDHLEAPVYIGLGMVLLALVFLIVLIVQTGGLHH